MNKKNAALLLATLAVCVLLGIYAIGIIGREGGGSFFEGISAALPSGGKEADKEQNIDKANSEREEDNQTQVVVIDTPLDTGEEDPEEAENEGQNGGAQNNNEQPQNGGAETGQKPEPVRGGKTKSNNLPAITASNDEQLKDYWSAIDNVTGVADNYYSENSDSTRIVSKNGRLYNLAARQYVDINYLCNREGLDRRYATFRGEVLFIRGSDLKKYHGIVVNSADMGPSVFVAVKHPTEEKYLISSNRSMGGLLTTEQYSELMYSYVQEHGTIRRLYPDSGEYEKIINFVKMYEGVYDDYYVRSVSMDDKYAFATLSPKSNVNDVRQYVLRKDGSFWEVVASGLSNMDRLSVSVNYQIPDFNLSLLPDYEVSGFMLKDNYADVLEALTAEGKIADSLDISYIAGTDKYVYAVNSNGLRHVCTLENGVWLIEDFSSYSDAYMALQAKTTVAPMFIMLDE